MVTPLVNNWGADPPAMGERYARSEKLALFGTTDSPTGHRKSTCEKATSHKDVGFLLVGVDVLGDPLRQKFNTQKAKNNPRQIFKVCRGILWNCVRRFR